MSFIVSSQQIQFFNHNKFIEFDDFIDENSTLLLEKVIATLSPSKPSLKWGLDIWRNQQALKPIITSSKTAKVAGQLKNLTELRYGFSQILSSQCYCENEHLQNSKSCLKKLVVGLCICLKPAEEIPNPFLPKKRNGALFFNIDPDFFLKFPRVKGLYLFIFFVDAKARFYMQELPNSLEQSLKNLGYENGDFLKDALNPVYRRIHV